MAHLAPRVPAHWSASLLSQLGTAAILLVMLGGCAHSEGSGPPTGTPTPQPVNVVGIGDSYMSAQDANGHSFMQIFGTQLEAALGRPAIVTVFAEGDSTSASTVDALGTRSDVKAAMSSADLVVISVGSNDVDPFGVFPKETCKAKSRAACLKAYAPDLTNNYQQIFSALDDLAPDHLVVRVTSVDNPFVGMAEAPSRSFGRDFYAQVAEAETEAIFAVAAEHGARGVDYLHVFCGPDGLDDPAKYLASDHAHPGDLGIHTIADLLTAMRIDP